jgi:hypothetical protein
VARGITEPLFWTVNYTALAITVVVVALEWATQSVVSAALAVGWLSLLMFANALFHIAGSVRDGSYMPGLVTALFLYLPLHGLVIRRVIREHRLRPASVCVIGAIGALPMLAHGYLIVFRGSRLF